MKKNDIERDPQLTSLLKDGFAARTPDESDRFTRRVMQRLPKRRRKPLPALILAYVQSPFWLVTAIVVCAMVLALRTDYLLTVLDNSQNIILLVVALPLAAAILSIDMLRDMEKAPAR